MWTVKNGSKQGKFNEKISAKFVRTKMPTITNIMRFRSGHECHVTKLWSADCFHYSKTNICEIFIQFKYLHNGCRFALNNFLSQFQG